jgi:hypothetical protein
MTTKKVVTKKVEKPAKKNVKAQSIVGSKVRFAKSEEAIIKKNRKVPVAVLAEILHRTESSIRHKKLAMGL